MLELAYNLQNLSQEVLKLPDLSSGLPTSA